MGYLEFCSNCGEKNKFGRMDGNERFYCSDCGAIHYENPKPTTTLICPRNDEVLLVKRALEPGKGLWGLPGGFLENGETLETGAQRELMEETKLKGEVKEILGTCSHFNSIFGDILLIGLVVHITDWSTLEAGDDASEAALFKLRDKPKLAFPCHEKIVDLYKQQNTA